MSTQKALLIPLKGSSFELGTRMIMKPGPGQVLIKNVAVALNPVDHYIMKFAVFVEQYGYPAVAGSDGAGDITEVGEGVTGWSVGDKVFYQSFWPPDHATFQEYTVADVHRITKIPSNLTYEQAATVPLGFATAACGLYAPFAERGGAGLVAPWEEGGRGKYAGQPALVIGGSSSVGQFTIQLLKLSGFSPIITTASVHNADYALAAGATHVIDYHTTPYLELKSAIASITNKPFSLVYDAISVPESQRACWDILAPGGTMLIVLHPAVGKPGEVVDDKRLALVLAVVGDKEGATANAKLAARYYQVLSRLLESGEIKPNTVELLRNGLAGIPDGVARFGVSISGVKLVARVDETP